MDEVHIHGERSEVPDPADHDAGVEGAQVYVREAELTLKCVLKQLG